MELKSIINGLRQERDRLDKAITALESMGARSGAGIASTGKRQMSAAGRAAIVAAQKRRWAKVRAAK